MQGTSGPVLLLGLGLMLACTPTQRRSAGAGMAGVGLGIVCVAGVMSDPCIIHDDEQARRDCHRDLNTPRGGGPVLPVAGLGAAAMALGGLIYLSGAGIQRAKPRPWRLKPAPPSAPAPSAKP